MTNTRTPTASADRSLDPVLTVCIRKLKFTEAGLPLKATLCYGPHTIKVHWDRPDPKQLWSANGLQGLDPRVIDQVETVIGEIETFIRDYPPLPPADGTDFLQN